MSRFRGKSIKNLFDYQRFKRDSGLAKRIEETNLRFEREQEAFALPDEAVGAVSGAKGGRNFVLCAICGAVLRGEEALRAHITDVHHAQWP